MLYIILIKITAISLFLKFLVDKGVLYRYVECGNYKKGYLHEHSNSKVNKQTSKQANKNLFKLILFSTFLALSIFLTTPKTANAYLCTTNQCGFFYQGFQGVTSWPTGNSPNWNQQDVGIGESGGGGGSLGGIFGGLFQSPEFINCQAQWSQYSQDCQDAVNERSAQVEEACEWVASFAGALGNRQLGAIALGCRLGNAAGQRDGEEQCSKDAIEGILENCLG